MTVVRFYLGISCFAILTSILTGCFVIRDTTEEWRNSECSLKQDGPGASEAKLIRWNSSKVELDKGNRIAIGFFPAFAGPECWPENIHDNTDYFISVSFVNCLSCCIPTACNLIFGTLLKEARRPGNSWPTLLGSYEWSGSKGAKEVVIDKKCEDVIYMSGSRSITGSVFSEAQDGTKLYFMYPGNEVIKKDIASLGSVAVMFDYPVQKYRLFYPAQEFKGHYGFKDIDVGDTSAEMIQSRYYKRYAMAKASISSLLSHGSLGKKAYAVMRALDNLILALPNMNKTLLEQLEKDAASLVRAAKDHELMTMRRRAAERRWQNEDDLKDFALRESPSIWQLVQQL